MTKLFKGDSLNTAELIRKRLALIVGDYQANELLEAPNFALGGRTAQELLDRGQFRPVEILVAEIEAQHDLSDIDENAADPILDRLPQVRSEGGVARIFSILDELESEGGTQ